MGSPALVVIDDDTATEGELRKRYGGDYQVVAYRSAEEALGALPLLGAPVAVVLAQLWLWGMTGVELLARIHELQPTARRALLASWSDEPARERILDAFGLGQIDCHLPRPGRAPDEGFHQVVGELLAEWATANAARPALVRLVGDKSAPRCAEIRDLLERYSIPFSFFGAESADGRRLLADAGTDASSCPVMVLRDGRVLVDPSNLEAADALGGSTHLTAEPYDVVVVGAGPAGLAAAVYGASEGLRTLVVEREAVGGQAGTTSRIRNYLGFPRGVSGSDLANRAFEQALHFGAQFHVMRESVQLHPGEPYHRIALSDGHEVRARTVIVATGVTYRRLGVASVERLVGRGVFYSPAMSEAPAMASQPVFIVGGGNSAGQAAVHMARYASQVTLVVRGRSLDASMSDYLIREIDATRNIAVRFQVEVAGALGEHHVEGLLLRDRRDGTTETVAARAVFVLIGGEPRTDWLPREIERCARGYVVTGADAADGDPLVLETSVPGIFAAGDVRHRSVKRVASAAGEGAMVIALVHERLARAASQLVSV